MQNSGGCPDLKQFEALVPENTTLAVDCAINTFQWEALIACDPHPREAGTVITSYKSGHSKTTCGRRLQDNKPILCHDLRVNSCAKFTKHPLTLGFRQHKDRSTSCNRNQYTKARPFPKLLNSCCARPQSLTAYAV